MRRRDTYAIVFCVLSTALLSVGTLILFRTWTICVLLTVAWLALILTRPRMMRVLRRLRGEEVDAYSYYHD